MFKDHVKGDWWAVESFMSKSEVIGHCCNWCDAVVELWDDHQKKNKSLSRKPKTPLSAKAPVPPKTPERKAAVPKAPRSPTKSPAKAQQTAVKEAAKTIAQELQVLNVIKPVLDRERPQTAAPIS